MKPWCDDDPHCPWHQRARLALRRSLSAAQLMKLASRNTLLCSFRVDDNLVWSLLTNHAPSKVGNEATNTLHANILMASRVSEVL